MTPHYVRGDMERRTCVRCNRMQKFPPTHDSAKETEGKEREMKNGMEMRGKWVNWKGGSIRLLFRLPIFPNEKERKWCKKKGRRCERGGGGWGNLELFQRYFKFYECSC